MPAADDLALLLDAAQAAGRIAMAARGRPLAIREKPGGAGPVTEADLAIDRMLAERLLAARPDYGWLSEETADDPRRLSAERVFIVDPIDGTRPFIAGQPDFAHALAIAEAGRVVAAVVHLPALGRTYAARAGAGATLNGRPIAVSPRIGVEGAAVLASRGQLDPALWPGGVPGLRRQFRHALAYRLCLAAEGAADAALTLRPAWEWDVAAGCLIATEAGGRATTPTGATPRFNAPEPRLPGLLVAGPALHADLIARLSDPRPMQAARG